MNPAQDDTTAAALLLGPAAFTAQLEDLLDPAYRLAMVMLDDAHPAAEDVVLRASLRAWRRSGEVRGPGRFRPWFLAIVAGGCLAARRRRRWVGRLRRMEWASRLRRLRRATEPAEAAPQPAPAPHPGGELGEAVRQLDVRDRAALFCRCYLDLPMEEVAAVLRVSEPSARRRVWWAAEALRPGLEPVGDLW